MELKYLLPIFSTKIELKSSWLLIGLPPIVSTGIYSIVQYIHSLNDTFKSIGIYEFLEIFCLQNFFHVLRKLIVELSDVWCELVLNHRSVNRFFD